MTGTVKNRMKYKAAIIAVSGLVLALSLCGCFTKAYTSKEEKEHIKTGKMIADEAVKDEIQREDSVPEEKWDGTEEPNDDTRKSLASRMCGKYSYHCGADEDGYEKYLTMYVLSFGDNLYAFCGEAMAEDDRVISPYSFWTSEFIPYDEDEMESTTGDSVRVNELRFSIMSNLGKYWDSGQSGTITLTDDGLEFRDFDDEEFLCPKEYGGRLFLKDERIEDIFPYLNDSGHGDDELSGLWMLDKSDESLFLEFDASNLTVYDKAKDREVFYARGGCEFKDGSFTCTANSLRDGGMPYEWSADYMIDGDRLTIYMAGDALPYELDGRAKLVRAREKDIHVFTMDEVEIDESSLIQPYGAEEEDQEPTGRKDYYGVFVSSAKSSEKCVSAVDRLEEAGFSQCCVIYTPDYSELNPEPYYVVAAILSPSKEEAEKTLAEVRKLGYKDAYVKYAGQYIGDR